MKTNTSFIQQVDAIIYSNIKHPHLNRYLVSKLGYSPSQLYRQLKQHTKLSPSVYIRQKRLEIAHLWIPQTDTPIFQIAQEVGFNNIAYFSRSFKALYGYSPYFLRKKNKE